MDVLLSCPLQNNADFACKMNLLLAQRVEFCPDHYRMLGSIEYDADSVALQEIAFIFDKLCVSGLALNIHDGAIYLGKD